MCEKRKEWRHRSSTNSSSSANISAHMGKHYALGSNIETIADGHSTSWTLISIEALWTRYNVVFHVVYTDNAYLDFERRCVRFAQLDISKLNTRWEDLQYGCGCIPGVACSLHREESLEVRGPQLPFPRSFVLLMRRRWTELFALARSLCLCLFCFDSFPLCSCFVLALWSSSGQFFLALVFSLRRFEPLCIQTHPMNQHQPSGNVPNQERFRPCFAKESLLTIITSSSKCATRAAVGT